MHKISELQSAIERLFSHKPPKKELSAEKVRLVIAEYFAVEPEEIELSNVTAALRQVSFAIPKTKLRGSSHISWVFIIDRQPEKKQPKKKVRLYKEKSLIESQRLKH